MVRTSLASLVVAAVALTQAPPASSKCARVMLAPQVITHAADTIPARGGVLVGYTGSTDDSAEAFADHDPANNSDWTLTVGKRKVRPRIEQLAPGLAVYRPGALRGTRPTPLALRDGKGAKLGSFSVSPRGHGGDLPTPTLVKITSVSTTSNRGRYPSTLVTTTATVDQVPAEAAALIIYRQTGSTTTAIAWGRVATGSTAAIVVYETPGRCRTEPDGLGAPSPGESVVAAWVDQFGRLSPVSAAAVVK